MRGIVLLSFAVCTGQQIYNSTVRDNILFGLPYDEEKYARTIRMACLEKDFDQFAAGDLTEIGEKGGFLLRITVAHANY